MISTLKKYQHVGGGHALAKLLGRDIVADVDLVPHVTGFSYLAPVTFLLEALEDVGAHQRATELAHRFAAELRPNLNELESVADTFHRVGAGEALKELAARIVVHADLVNPRELAKLLRALRRSKLEEAAEILLDRHPVPQVGLSNPYAVVELLKELVANDAPGQAKELAVRAAIHVDFAKTLDVVTILSALRENNLEEAIATLLTRNPAAHVALDNPHNVGSLLRELRMANADKLVHDLAARAAAHCALTYPNPLDTLLAELRDAGETRAYELLESRVANAGLLLFHDFGEYGSDIEGRPERPWTWDDLGYQ